MLKRATFDSRAVKPGMTFVALKGEKADGRDFIPQALAAGAAEIIDGYDALDREAWLRRRSLKAQVVGVTGSAGKTTTKELLRVFLSRLGRTDATEGNFNNHIGLPMTLLNTSADADFLVLEMGTNHPGEIAHLCAIAEPDAGVLTNIGTAHLEFFGTREGIAREKGRLLRAAKTFGVIPSGVYARDILRACAEDKELIEAPARAPDELAAAVARLLPGAHNQSNAAVAFAAAARYGLSVSEAVKALEDFRLPGARWRVSESAGVTYIDDTYNANPDAMIAALDAFKATDSTGRRIAVLGDMFELGEQAEAFHQAVFDHARALGLDVVLAVGDISSRCAADAAFPDVASARTALAAIVRPGDTVLVKASHGMQLGSVVPDPAS